MALSCSSEQAAGAYSACHSGVLSVNTHCCTPWWSWRCRLQKRERGSAEAVLGRPVQGICWNEIYDWLKYDFCIYASINVLYVSVTGNAVFCILASECRGLSGEVNTGVVCVIPCKVALRSFYKQLGVMEETGSTWLHVSEKREISNIFCLLFEANGMGNRS